MLTSAPACTKTSTILVCPLQLARDKAVQPSWRKRHDIELCLLKMCLAVVPLFEYSAVLSFQPVVEQYLYDPYLKT